MDWMRERVQDVECRFNSCKSILDSVTHTHSTRLPVVRLIPSHPPLSLSLSRVTCAGLWIAAAALCVSFCVSEREAQGCTPLRASRTLSQHTFTHAHAFIQTGGFHHPRHTVCCPAEHCDFRLREPDGEEGIFTQDPSMICNSMRSPCQTSFQGWVEHSRWAGDEGGMDRGENRTWNWGLFWCQRMLCASRQDVLEFVGCSCAVVDWFYVLSERVCSLCLLH